MINIMLRWWMIFGSICFCQFSGDALAFEIINERGACIDTHTSPQSYVDIEQLTGMWFGIEILNHDLNARHELVIDDICPVLYFSQDHIPTTTYNPLHRDYNYEQNYANNYGRGYYDRNLEGLVDEDRYMYTTQNPYYRSYPSTNDNRGSRYYNNRYDEQRRREFEDIKSLRLLWDKAGVNFEYTMHYNKSKAGLWMNIQNVSNTIEPRSIQVLKAVGNHMLLLFCHQTPERHMFSMLLSRVQNMSQFEIHGVHNLLMRRGLSTISIRRLCLQNSGSKATLQQINLLIAMMIGVYLCKMIMNT